MGSKNFRVAGFGERTRKAGALFAILAIGIIPVSAQSSADRETAIKHLRGVLEQPFLESGGFSAFDCSLTSGEQPTQPFTCDAGTAAGNHYQYLLIPDPVQGLLVNLVTEPAAQLDYEWLPPMESVCKQFLEQFNQTDWDSMYASFDPNLQKLVPATRLETDLTPMREQLGATSRPTLESYSARDGGRHELQFSVPAENGRAAFRCGLHVTENSVTVLAFLVTPYPGTPLYNTGLEKNAVLQLSDLIGDQVTKVEIPYDQLANVYDHAEGVAILANAERVRLWVTRSGRLDDFSQFDYTFAVIEDSKP